MGFIFENLHPGWTKQSGRSSITCDFHFITSDPEHKRVLTSPHGSLTPSLSWHRLWHQIVGAIDFLKELSPKGNQSWIFTARTDAEAETPILGPPDVKNWLLGKDPDAGKDWRQEEKGMTEDEMVGWHHRIDGCEFEQAPGVGDGQGSLACCSPWVAKSRTRLSNWANWLNGCRGLPTFASSHMHFLLTPFLPGKTPFSPKQGCHLFSEILPNTPGRVHHFLSRAPLVRWPLCRVHTFHVVYINFCLSQ